MKIRDIIKDQRSVSPFSSSGDKKLRKTIKSGEVETIGELKECQYCSKEIRYEAIKCKYCKKFLELDPKRLKIFKRYHNSLTLSILVLLISKIIAIFAGYMLYPAYGVEDLETIRVMLMFIQAPSICWFFISVWLVVSELKRGGMTGAHPFMWCLGLFVPLINIVEIFAIYGKSNRFIMKANQVVGELT